MNVTNNQPIRVGLADKNPLIQAALKQLLSEDRRFDLVHVASDCATFLQNIERETIDVGVIGWIFGPCDGRYILDHLSDEKHAPRIVVYTGDGKGKTTASLGLVLRALGQGLRPAVLQFMKSDPTWGEIVTLRKLGVPVVQCGLDHWVLKGEASDDDLASAAEGLERARALVHGGEHDVVILDELVPPAGPFVLRSPGRRQGPRRQLLTIFTSSLREIGRDPTGRGFF